MSGPYRLVQWDGTKRRYDAAIGATVALSVGAYAGTTAALNPGMTAETIIIRTTATAALVLLHVILMIGPLARLDARFLPLLYNRRHLGVTTFLLALIHGAFSILQFHGFGAVNPLVSIVAGYGRDYAPPDVFRAPRFLPFEVFGIVALGLLFLLAATSHDFWLKHLGAWIWKSLHQGVYAVYGLVLVHVSWGALQSERSPLLPVLMSVGFVAVMAVHLAAAARESAADKRRDLLAADGFLDACAASDLADGRARVAMVGGERLAVWLHNGRVYATSNTCRHQGGPLGEGRIRDGCITCPWHGWTYRVEDGVSPPPFHEHVPTYPARLEAGRVLVNPTPNATGHVCAGASLGSEEVAR